MKLTVVGCSPAWPNPGGAQSGYLVEATGACCSTAAPACSRSCASGDGGWPDVDAIAITHWHLDHWGDLVPWVWGTLVPRHDGGPKPELWLPPEGRERLRRVRCAARLRGRCGSAPSSCATTARTSRSRPPGVDGPAVRLPHYRCAPTASASRAAAARSPTPATPAPSDALAELGARRRPLPLRGDARARRPRRRAARPPLGRRGVAPPSRRRARARLLLTHRPHELRARAGARAGRTTGSSSRSSGAPRAAR